MNHFNALDFNVCRSEEVISFFWHSVYMSVYQGAQGLSVGTFGYNNNICRLTPQVLVVLRLAMWTRVIISDSWFKTSEFR